MLRSVSMRERVTVSRSHLTVQREYLVKRTVFEIPRANVRRLRVKPSESVDLTWVLGKGNVVQAFDDGLLVEFGARLSARELAWLRDSVHYAVVALRRDKEAT